MPCVIVRLHNGVIMHCTVCVHINYGVDRQTSTVTLAAHAHRGS